MWSESKSLVLSKICLILFMALLLAAAILAPQLVRQLMLMSAQARVVGKELFLVTIYVGFVPSAALLVCLYKFLHRIGKGHVFVKENIAYLRLISWFCFFGAAVCLASGLYYLPWYTIGVAGAFAGIIVRVIKNLFAKAVSLQDDAELTI